MTQVELIPSNEHNDTLLRNVRPPQWQNPIPTDTYNLVIIGAGSAGLVAASGGAGLGAKVAIIEKGLMGGDCLNVGCVPSKALIRAAKVVGELRRGASVGVHVPEEAITVDFKAVMGHVWQARAAIAPHDSAERYRKLGVDVFFGSGVFTGPNTIQVDGQTLTFKKAVIATGSRPLVLPIPGLAEAGFLTNETLWNLTEQPRSLAIIGGGPIGAELAQAFQRLGTEVTLIDIAPRILPREDAAAAAIVESALVSDGVTILTDTKTTNVRAVSGGKQLTLETPSGDRTITVDDILLAVGRAPNVENLGLEQAGVAYTRKGVSVDDYLRTTNPNIYAAGDVALKYQFTHVAGHAAGIVLQNALFPAPKRKVSDLIIPWATYTDPEVAHVGLYSAEAAEQGIAIDTYTVHMDENDRAVSDADTEGFVQILTKQGSDEIVGATIVGRHAGELITEVTLAMTEGVGLGKLTRVIHPYPTQAEAIYKAAINYNRTRLTPIVEKAFGWWLKRARRA